MKLVFLRKNKKPSLAEVVFKEAPKGRLKRFLIEQGFPCIENTIYFSTYWKIHDLYERLKEDYDHSEIFFEEELKEEYSFYKECINYKKTSLEKHIDKLNGRINDAYGTKLFDHQDYFCRWAGIRNALILADDMGTGKASPLDSKVLTPNGWIAMSDIEIGSEVIGRNGKSIKVTGIYPQGIKDVYGVKFTDGAYLECCLEHLWAVKSRQDRREKRDFHVASLEDIKKDFKLKDSNLKKGFRLNYSIPLVDEIEFSEQKEDLFIHPYLLGMLLGDGSFCSGYSCSPTLKNDSQEVIDFIKEILPTGYILSPVSKNKQNNEFRLKKRDYLRTDNIGERNKIINELKRLGLWGKNSFNKFVPDVYKKASIGDRKLLLQGYMDADGSISRNGQVSFKTVSSLLFDDIKFIINSLGGIVKRNKDSKTKNGKAITGTVNLRFNPFKNNVFRKSRFKDSFNNCFGRKIAEINFIGKKECQCIKVDSEDCLYVANDFVVTHNTLSAVASVPTKAPVLIVCPANAKYVWLNQFKRWVGREATVLSGRKSFRFPKDREIVIINYDILPEDLYERPPKHGPDGKEIEKKDRDRFNRGVAKRREALLASCPEGLVIIADEAHKLKNTQSLRSKRFIHLSDRAKSLNGKVWALTGTPLSNRPEELYAIIRAIGAVEESFGNTKNLQKALGGKILGGGNFVWGNPEPSIKYYLANIMLRRRKRDLFDLPRLLIDDLQVDVDEKTKKACDEFVELLERLGISLEEALELARDVSSEMHEHIMSLKKKIAIAKIPGVVSILDDYKEAGEKVIVASNHVSPLEFFGARPGWAVITGDTSAKERDRIEKDFQSGKYDGLALSEIAGGEALTLTAAPTIIVLDKPWTPTTYDQVLGRIDRIGQKGKFNKELCEMVINAYDVICGHPIETRINDILKRKGDLIKATIERLVEVDLTKRRGNIL